MDTFKQSILELESRKINAPVIEYNHNFRFAYHNLLQEMYDRDLTDNKNFTDPQCNYSSNISNNIILRICETNKIFVFENYSERSLLYLQTLPQKSQNYISLLNNIVLNRYVFDANDEWNIKYYYTILKFIPIYFELTLGVFNTPHNIRNKYIIILNGILDIKIILGLEEYSTYNFWIKDMFKKNSDLVIPFIKMVESIYADPNLILSKSVPKKPKVIISREQNKELVVDKVKQLFKFSILKKIDTSDKIESIVNTKTDTSDKIESIVNTKTDTSDKIESIVNTKTDTSDKIESTINTKIDIITKKLDKLNKLDSIMSGIKKIKKNSKTDVVKKKKTYKYHELEAYTVVALKKECIKLGLQQSGLKQDIIRRLVEFNN